MVWFRARKGDVESQRTLIVDGCAAVTEASTLLLLLTLDPVLAESLGANRMVAQSDNTPLTPEVDSHNRPTQPTSVPSPPGKTQPPSLPSSSASRQPATPTATSTHAAPVSAHERWSVGAWAALGGATISQITPALGVGVAAEGGIRVERLRLGIRGGWIQSMSAALDEVAGASVSARMLRIHLTTAFELGPRSVRFGPALDLGVDHLTTEAEGISVSRPGSTALLSTAAGVWTNVVITGNCGLAARVGALFPLERPRFQVTRLIHPVHQPGVIGLDGFIGLFYAWGSQS